MRRLIALSAFFFSVGASAQVPCVDVANAALKSLQLPLIGETAKPIGKRFNIKRTGETLARPEISDGLEVSSPEKLTSSITTEPQGVGGWTIHIERKKSEDVRVHRMKTRLTFATQEKDGVTMCRFTRAEFAHFAKSTDEEVWKRKTIRCLNPKAKVPKGETAQDTEWIRQDCETAMFKTP